jgi:hypothetical protein
VDKKKILEVGTYGQIHNFEKGADRRFQKQDKARNVKFERIWFG